jgi:hypothetical protein
LRERWSPIGLLRALRTLVTAISGRMLVQPMADQRREKLARFLCSARDGHPSVRLRQEVIELGFTRRQVDALALLARDDLGRRE